jgi:hypothetical protein
LAWPESAAVPAVVFVAAPSALRRAFAVVAGSAADAAARVAVFWRRRPVAELPLRVPAPAAAGLPGVPAAASRGADPVLAGAFCPARRSWSVGQRVAVEAEPRSDVRPMRVADWLVAPRYEEWQAGLADGSAAVLPASSRLASEFPVLLADRKADPADDSAAVPCLAAVPVWSRSAWRFQALLAGRRAGSADVSDSVPQSGVCSSRGQDDRFAAAGHFEAGLAGSSAPALVQRQPVSGRRAVRL